MKGVICKEQKKTFEEAINSMEFGEIERRPLQQGEVRVKVYAASLNFFDLLQLVGKYQSKVNFPFTPGSEGSGEVVELYEGEGEEGEDGEGKLKVGEKVIFGMSTGTLAREVVISRTMIMPYPRHLSAEEAAALPVGYCTAYHGLIQRAQLKKGEIVFITGAAGGMGLSAIQLSKMAGAKVIAGASTIEKVELAKRMGADEGVVYGEGGEGGEGGIGLNEKIKRMVGEVDVVYDVVGGKVFNESMRVMRGGGRLLVVGFAGGEISKVPMNLPLVKGYSIVGVRAGAEMILHPHVRHQIFSSLSPYSSPSSSSSSSLPHLPPPYVHRVYYLSDEQTDEEKIEEVKRAYRDLAARRSLGKLVISFSSPPPSSRL